MQKLAVISAVNLVEGGTLTVLLDCLDSAASILGPEWRIIALVHRRSLVSNPRIECIEYPRIKKSWILRIWLEWFGWRAYSRRLHADLWLSMHDITPIVHARKQVVYCHNPNPFFHVSLREAWFEPKILLFRLLYKYIYQFNILRNDHVIVQQNWLRAEFKARYSCPSIIVAHPRVPPVIPVISPLAPHTTYVLLYPALPRAFKNFEVICEAAARLRPEIASKIELRLTLNGNENRYARAIVQRYKHIDCLKFIGRQSRQVMQEHYACSDAIIFPSKLETWGLPISEGKAYNKALLVADLPYARETVGNYDRVAFIEPGNADTWANKISELSTGDLIFDGNQIEDPAQPFAADWDQLWQKLTNQL